jgi:hypothetical protein
MYANMLLDIALLNAEKGGTIIIREVRIPLATTEFQYCAVI